MKGNAPPSRASRRTPKEAAAAKVNHKLKERQRQAMKKLRAGEVVDLLVIPYRGGKRRWMRVRPMTAEEQDRGYADAPDPRFKAPLVAIAGRVVCEGLPIDKDGRAFATRRRDYYQCTLLGVVVQESDGCGR